MVSEFPLPKLFVAIFAPFSRCLSGNVTVARCCMREAPASFQQTIKSVSTIPVNFLYQAGRKFSLTAMPAFPREGQTILSAGTPTKRAEKFNPAFEAD